MKILSRRRPARPPRRIVQTDLQVTMQETGRGPLPLLLFGLEELAALAELVGQAPDATGEVATELLALSGHDVIYRVQLVRRQVFG